MYTCCVYVEREREGERERERERQREESMHACLHLHAWMDGRPHMSARRFGSLEVFDSIWSSRKPPKLVRTAGAYASGRNSMKGVRASAWASWAYAPSLEAPNTEEQ